MLSKKYVNAITKLKYRCSCGNISKILLHSFKQGHRCMKCSHKRIAIKLSHNLEYIKYFFKKEGCILLSNNYINSNSKLEFICDCGNKSVNTFSKFKEGRRCKECGEKRKIHKLKHSYEHVKDYFNKKECKLISKEYINDATPLNYICNCGNKSKITFNSFHNGSRCNKCGVEKTMGEKSVHWNYNLTDEEREANKSRLSDVVYIRWRKNVFIKDDYVCCKCDQKGGKLNAHHILNYSNYKQLRLDINNGITLCVNCHKKFHKKYGIKNNNDIQLGEFLQKEISYV